MDPPVGCAVACNLPAGLMPSGAAAKTPQCSDVSAGPLTQLFLSDVQTILVCDDSRPLYLVYPTNFLITPSPVGSTSNCVIPPAPPPTVDVVPPDSDGSEGSGP
jgi:hypothetical protein